MARKTVLVCDQCGKEVAEGVKFCPSEKFAPEPANPSVLTFAAPSASAAVLSASPCADGMLASASTQAMSNATPNGV